MNIKFNKKLLKSVGCAILAGFVIAGGVHALFNKNKDNRYPRLKPIPFSSDEYVGEISIGEVEYIAPNSSYSLVKDENGVHAIKKVMMERIPEKYVDENGNEEYIKYNDEVIVDGIAYREITVMNDPIVRRK